MGEPSGSGPMTRGHVSGRGAPRHALELTSPCHGHAPPLLPACSDPARQVTARPSSINELPEYGCDPRTPDKLVDGGWGVAPGAGAVPSGVACIDVPLASSWPRQCVRCSSAALSPQAAGANSTCDCSRMWLAPFTAGALHTVAVGLDAPAALGALRVWNYNKSRVGSLRGAR